MAASGCGGGGNTEIGSKLSLNSLDLSEFVRTFALPECVCVTDGSYLSKTVQISKGDVILLKSCDPVRRVTVSYKDEGSRSWTEVRLPLDYPHKFLVLPPKDSGSDNRAVSMISYPTVSDLLLDSPTYFEATTLYEDPYLPGHSVKPGDRFRFVEIVKDLKDGQDGLKVKDENGHYITLSSECRGNFFPLKDEREYSLKELIELAPVQRRLRLVEGDSRAGVKIAPEISDEYTAVIKPKKLLDSSFSSSVSSLGEGGDSLPAGYTGVVHLQKPEPMLLVSPYNDPDTVWNIPISSNLWVRPYSEDEYEVPAPKKITHPLVPLPLPASSHDQPPPFQAPSDSPAPPKLVPLKITSFVDAHLPSFPVKAKVLDTTEASPFFRKILRNVDDVIVYRVDEAKRLFVKDAKSDNVFSLSHDLKLSFIEYPEKFKTVLNLLHLPAGTEVTVLEDIAADFPKPFSLRFGDILRIAANNPYFIKMKHAARDCEVLKCFRLDPDGGEPTKLKLPLDFEINMAITTDHSSRKMVTLQDLLSGAAPIPKQEVASFPDASESDILKELPVDVQILKSMKELFLVVQSKKPVHTPSSTWSRKAKTSLFSPKQKTEAPLPCEAATNPLPSPKDELPCVVSDKAPERHKNIGLPVNSGLVLGYVERLDIFELDVEASEADYIRAPIERMTMAEYEERERLRKLNIEYEDVEFGSNSTLDETGERGHLPRAGSTGLLERKEKKTKMDKVRRFSKALNPKHWRQPKAEPEPLPHPSAMGLMALASRLQEGEGNEYQHQQIDSRSSTMSTSSGREISSGEEVEENFYEDVEIGPVKAATFAAPQARQTGAFSSATHRSLPMPKLPPRLLSSKNSNSRHGARNLEDADTASGPLPVTRVASYEEQSNLTKAKNWATSLTTKFSMKPKVETPGKTKHGKEDMEKNNHTQSLRESPMSRSSTAQAEGTPLRSTSREQVNDNASTKKSSNDSVTNRHQTSNEKTPSETGAMSRPENKQKPVAAIEKDNEPAPIAPKRRKAMKLNAEKNGSGSDIKDSDVKVENLAHGNSIPSKDDTESNKDKRVEHSKAHDTNGSSLEPKHESDKPASSPEANGKAEPPRPKPRNINKTLMAAEVSNPPLPPRGEPAPRIKKLLKSVDLPSNNTVAKPVNPTRTTDADISRPPRPPPKPRVSQHSEV
ncbi:uncharacterized protein LOC131949282 [Physella acuta]|uniref:uncharacterized protein LOC131949282 n=1 Tax=Physella acuta TaxID=109671 RepID=UPI0027DE7640|nr:uncharacterized protein LOC131949282 [Physella acuta]